MGKSKKVKALGRWNAFFKWSKWLLLCILIYSLYSGYQIYKIGHTDAGGDADCAVVLGAAAWHKKPSPVFAARLDHAILLYQSGRVKKLLLTGGKGKGAEYAEAEVAYAYCVEKGVKKTDIVMETQSLTTHENIIEAKKVMEQHDLKIALLVSDPWHLRRATLMAEGEGLEASASATKTSKFESLGAKSSFFMREFFFVQVYRFFRI